MKRTKSVLWMAVALAAGMVSAAHARAEGSSSHVGGGDDAVTLPDGRVQAADAYADVREAVPPALEGEALAIGPELKRMLEAADAVLKNYGSTEGFVGVSMDLENWEARLPYYRRGERWLSRDGSASYQSMLLWHLLGPSATARFLLNESLPCEDTLDEVQLPEGAQQAPVACTVGNTTWIRPSVFSRLSALDQAIVLIHERLHSVPVEMSHRRILAVTRGLHFALSLRERQMQGERPVLDADQIRILRAFQTGLRNTGFTAYTNLELYRIWPRGGGLVHIYADQVDPSAYVGAGSIVAHGCRVEAGVELLESVCSSSWLRRGVSLVRANVVSGDYANVYWIRCLRSGNGSCKGYHRAYLEEGVRIQDSDVAVQTEGGDIVLSPEVRIAGSYVGLAPYSRLGRAAKLDSVALDFDGPFVMGTGSSISNSSQYTRISNSSVLWFRVATLSIPDGSAIDLEGMPLCPESQSDRLMFNTDKKVRSRRDWIDLAKCR